MIGDIMDVDNYVGKEGDIFLLQTFETNLKIGFETINDQAKHTTTISSLSTKNKVLIRKVSLFAKINSISAEIKTEPLTFMCKKDLFNLQDKVKEILDLIEAHV